MSFHSGTAPPLLSRASNAVVWVVDSRYRCVRRVEAGPSLMASKLQGSFPARLPYPESTFDYTRQQHQGERKTKPLELIKVPFGCDLAGLKLSQASQLIFCCFFTQILPDEEP